MKTVVNTVAIVLLGVLVVQRWGGAGVPVPPPDATPVPAPSAAMQTAVAPLQALSGDTRFAAQAHRSLLAVLERNPSAIETSGQLHDVLNRFGVLLWANTPGAQSVPGFGAAMDASLKAAFGDTDRKIESAEAVDFVRAVVWALEG